MSIHVFEVSLGGEVVAEDVDATGHDRDARRERGLHLHWVVALVGSGPSSAPRGRVCVQGVDDEVDKDIAAEVAAGLVGEHFET
eukprot:1061140-Rhodomonas_salina.1